jgi:2-haloacid dehalogenase
MAVKALTFDIIGTVFDWLGSFSAGVVPLAQKYGLSIDPVTFANRTVDGYSARYTAVGDGGPWIPPDEILRDSITSVLSAGGHAPSANEVDDFFALWRTLDPWPDVPPALHALHDHFTLAILSNMSIATQSALMDHAGLPFDRTLSAETVHAYKPDPRVYRMAISSLGLPPSEIMMVAAHQFDLTAAKAEGMQTAFVARSSESPPSTPNPANDINVTTYGELLDELGAGPPTLE